MPVAQPRPGGPRLILAAEDEELALLLVRQLVAGGALVAVVAPRPLPVTGVAASSVPADLADPAAVAGAFARAAADLGGADAVVAAVLDSRAGTPMARSTAADWHGEAELPLLRCGAVTTAAKVVLGSAGAIVYVVSSAACRGVSATAAGGAASEGVRGLAKSAARIWPDLRVNLVAADPPWSGTADAAPGEELAGVILALAASPALAPLSGATLFVDGGQAMVP
jgi:hypothetical protein